jgi:hypothetical protein
VRSIPEQPERDVHADLCPAAGQQGRLAGEVGSGVALGVTHGGAVRAELVVERVDDRERLLADVAGSGLQEYARCGRGDSDGERDTAGLVVDAVRRTGRGRGNHRPVGIRDLRTLLEAAALLDRLEHAGRRPADGDEIRMLLVDPVHRREDAEGHLEVGRVDGGV